MLSLTSIDRLVVLQVFGFALDAIARTQHIKITYCNVFSEDYTVTWAKSYTEFCDGGYLVMTNTWFQHEKRRR